MSAIIIAHLRQLRKKVGAQRTLAYAVRSKIPLNLVLESYK